MEAEDPPGTHREATVHLSGPIWQGTMPPDTNSWKSVLGPEWPYGILTDPVALPQVSQYLSSHPGLPSSDPTHLFLGVNWRLYGLFAGVGNVRFNALQGSAFPSDGRLDRHWRGWFHGCGHGAATRKLSTWIRTVEVAFPANPHLNRYSVNSAPATRRTRS